MTSTLLMSVPTTAAEMEPQANAPQPPTWIQNPLQEDPVLQTFLNNLTVVKNARGFPGWRKAFLEHFKTFLEPEGVKKATKAYKVLEKSITRMMILILQMKALYSRDKKNKDLTHANRHGGNDNEREEDRTDQWFSVRSRQCLSELINIITHCTENLDALIPGTVEQEQMQGFTKFHMGAVLLHDQFSQHNRLLLCVDSLVRFEELLQDVADKQTLKTMEMFRFKFQIFCDIMADLGLFIATMHKCLEMDCEDDKAEDEVSVGTVLSFSTVDDLRVAMPTDVVKELVNIPSKPKVSQERAATSGDEEIKFHCHCSFCRIPIIEGFDRSIFCRGRKEERAQLICSPCCDDVVKEERKKTSPSPGRSNEETDRNKTEAELHSLPLTTPSSPSANTQKMERKDASYLNESSLNMVPEALNRMGSMHFDAMDKKNLSSQPKLSHISDISISHSEQRSSEMLNSPTRGLMVVAKDAIMPEEVADVSKMDKEKYYKLFKWYSRMGQPNRDMMKTKIAIIQKDAKELTVQDIDELPWVHHGLRVDVVAMNQLIYGLRKVETSKQLRAGKESW